MRAPVDTISAPEFLPHLRWLNVKRLRMDQLRGRPVLVEFWDFCRPNSLRTLPYLMGWHERYGRSADDKAGLQEGLQVVGIHSPGFEPSRERRAVSEAVSRLGISHAVLIDSKLEMWQEYENMGWPARYLIDQKGMLYHYHYGEGAYAETELAIQELLGLDRAPLQSLRPEDAPTATLAPPSEDRPGAYCGPYEAGAVWAVLEGSGRITVSGSQTPGGELDAVRELDVAHDGAYPLIEHDRHTQGTLELALSPGLRCLQTSFLAGIL